MKKLFCLAIAALVMLPLQAHAQGINSGWFQCQSSADCAAVQTACNKWEGVNKRYAREFRATLRQWGPAEPGCPSQSEALAQKLNSRPECVGGYCAVVIPKSGSP